jgi:hypothetical protein
MCCTIDGPTCGSRSFPSTDFRRASAGHRRPASRWRRHTVVEVIAADAEIHRTDEVIRHREPG